MSKRKNKPPLKNVAKKNKVFPDRFPFWARLKISKHRTTLVIDEDIEDSKSADGKAVEVYVHREATHLNDKNKKHLSDYEEIKPNPDKTDKEPMLLKRPRKLPKKMFEPHNKKLDMPEHLVKRYDKNNHKNDS